jgi:hypothetical protein
MEYDKEDFCFKENLKDGLIVLSMIFHFSIAMIAGLYFFLFVMTVSYNTFFPEFYFNTINLIAQGPFHTKFFAFMSPLILFISLMTLNIFDFHLKRLVKKTKYAIKDMFKKKWIIKGNNYVERKKFLEDVWQNSINLKERRNAKKKLDWNYSNTVSVCKIYVQDKK